MIAVTPQIKDVDIPNDRFYLYIGNHGFPMEISKLKQMAKNTRHEGVTLEFLYYICILKIWNRSQVLGVDPQDLTPAQIKAAIETEVLI